jgi:hypothetical protein
MKMCLYLYLIMIFSNTVVGAAKPPEDTSRLYILQDVENKEWCGYDTLAQWQSKVDKLAGADTAFVDFKDSHPIVVQYTQQDREGGDSVISIC